jgi:hypothetical protein
MHAKEHHPLAQAVSPHEKKAPITVTITIEQRHGTAPMHVYTLFNSSTSSQQQVLWDASVGSTATVLSFGPSGNVVLAVDPNFRALSCHY